MSDHHYPPPASTAVPSNIRLRPATKSDAEALSDCFFRSFGESAAFWSTTFPAAVWRDWWTEAWMLGIEQDDTARTLVAVDDDRDGRVVGFARWIVPQADGRLDRVWPELPPAEKVDMEVVGTFFHGMAVNREEFMGKEPHWFLEMLGTETSYQRQGIGYAFCKWGCDLADKDDMRVYIDASQVGAPFYRKHLGADKIKIIELPDRPDTYGHYEYWTHIVPKKSKRTQSSKTT